MSQSEAIKVLQVGTPIIGSEVFQAAMARSDLPFELEAIATTDPDLRGKRLGRVDPRVPAELAKVPFIGMMDAIDNTDAPVVFSGLETRLAHRYDDRLAAGRLLVTGVATGQEELDAPAVSAFVNGDHLDELYARPAEGRIIEAGNSLAALVAVPLAPLDREVGLERLEITSLQGWSDVGMHRVPELVTDASTHTDIHPLDRARHQKVETDLSRLLGTSVDNPASAELTEATLQHAPWVRGHYAKIVATLGRDVTKSEVEELWRHFEAPAALGGIRKELKAISRLDKDKWPSRHQKIIPVKLEHGDLLRRHGDRQWLSRIRPMRVAAHVVELDPEEPRTLTFTIAGDNLIQGAVGGNLLNILYARAQGYLG